MDISNPLSNLSYTQKDFQTIYPELLDLVKKLTLKWDPSISNESDPGVILLKLNALIADKNNYNIDKNVLECFPLSVTQTNNARQMFEQIGYNMHWYVGGTTDITFRWLGETDFNSSMVVPKFTMVSDVDSKHVFTLVEGVTLKLDGSFQTSKAIQGRITDYDINGEKLITTADLDYNNRLYFIYQNIAENGIFIKNVDQENYDSWQKRDNLLVENLGQKIYKFGVDTLTNTCYIEFPDDVDELIGEGINLKYIKTEGAEGNVGSNIMENFYNPEPITYYTSDGEKHELTPTSKEIYVRNSSAVTDGKDPETIDSAYKNYKKTIGTFNTLVALRDYMNYINSIDMVSNCFVCDRTNDIQSTTKIVNDDNGIIRVENIVDDNSINAFTLKLYGLKFVDIVNNKASYDTTFEFETSSPRFKDTVAYIDEIKSIQHDFKTPMPLVSSEGNIEYTHVANGANTDIKYVAKDGESYSIKTDSYNLLFFKNYFPISIKIIPHYRLEGKEAIEVQEIVLKNLYEKLNAKELVFGEEIDYDYVYDILSNCDERINYVILDNIEYQTYAVIYLNSKKIIYELRVDDGFANKDSYESDLKTIAFDSNATDEDKKNLIALLNSIRSDIRATVYAKNILAGKTPLFVSTDNFCYRVNHTAYMENESSESPDDIVGIYKNISSIDTSAKVEVKIDSNYSSGTYKIRENENIQFFAPNLIEKEKYASYVKYEYFNISDDKYKFTDYDSYSSNTDESTKNTFTYLSKSNSTLITEDGISTNNTCEFVFPDKLAYIDNYEKNTGDEILNLIKDDKGLPYIKTYLYYNGPLYQRLDDVNFKITVGENSETRTVKVDPFKQLVYENATGDFYLRTSLSSGAYKDDDIKSVLKIDESNENLTISYLNYIPQFRSVQVSGYSVPLHPKLFSINKNTNSILITALETDTNKYAGSTPQEYSKQYLYEEVNKDAGEVIPYADEVRDVNYYNTLPQEDTPKYYKIYYNGLENVYAAESVIEKLKLLRNCEFKVDYRTAKGLVIYSNESKKLEEGEWIFFYWKDSDETDEYSYKGYGKGNIVSPSFILSGTSSTVGSTLVPKYLNNEFVVSDHVTNARHNSLLKESTNTTLTANDSISIKDENKVDLQRNNYIYAITNDVKRDESTGIDKYVLTLKYNSSRKVFEKTLTQGEYLLYSDSALSTLNILGSGTNISMAYDPENEAIKDENNYIDQQADLKLSFNKVDYSNIDAYGTKGISEKDWVYLNSLYTFGVTISGKTKDENGTIKDVNGEIKGYLMSATEQQFIVLGEGYEITVIKKDSMDRNTEYKVEIDGEGSRVYADGSENPLDGKTITNMFDITYKEKNSNTSTSLPIITRGSVSDWNVISKLNISSGPDKEQRLSKGHEVILKDEGGNEIAKLTPADDKDIYFESSVPLNFDGSREASVKYRDVDGNYKFVNIYAYSESKFSDDISFAENLYNDTYELSTAIKAGSEVKWRKVCGLKLPQGEYIVPFKFVTISGDGDYSIKLGLQNQETENTHVEELKLFSKDDGDTNINIKPSSMCYLKLKSDGSEHDLCYMLKEDTVSQDTELQNIISQDTNIRLIFHKVRVIADKNIGVSIKEIPEYKNGSNDESNNNDISIDDVSIKIRTLDKNGIFNYNYEVPTEDLIDKPLDAKSFFDTNHYYNKYTLPQIKGDIEQTILNKLK